MPGTVNKSTVMHHPSAWTFASLAEQMALLAPGT
jgi:hypothetical protein